MSAKRNDSYFTVLTSLVMVMALANGCGSGGAGVISGIADGLSGGSNMMTQTGYNKERLRQEAIRIQQQGENIRSETQLRDAQRKEIETQTKLEASEIAKIAKIAEIDKEIAEIDKNNDKESTDLERLQHDFALSFAKSKKESRELDKRFLTDNEFALRVMRRLQEKEKEGRFKDVSGMIKVYPDNKFAEQMSKTMEDLAKAWDEHVKWKEAYRETLQEEEEYEKAKRKVVEYEKLKVKPFKPEESRYVTYEQPRPLCRREPSWLEVLAHSSILNPDPLRQSIDDLNSNTRQLRWSIDDLRFQMQFEGMGCLSR